MTIKNWTTSTGVWDSSGNWSPAGVPGGADTAIFDTGAKAPYIVAAGFDTVGQVLVSQDSMTLTGMLDTGSLLIDNDATLTLIYTSFISAQAITIDGSGAELALFPGALSAAILATSGGMVYGRVPIRAGVTLAGGVLEALGDTTAPSLTVDGADNILIGDGAAIGPIMDGTIHGGIIADGGDVTLDGASSFSLGATIAAGVLELQTINAAGSGPISFAPGVSTELQIDTAMMPANAIAGFGANDLIYLSDIPYEAGMIIGSTASGLTLSQDGTIAAQLALAAPVSSVALVAAEGPTGGTEILSAVAASGISGSWSNPASWSPAAVPGSSGIVTIGSPGSFTIAVDGTQSTGTLELESAGATLAVDPGGTLVITSGLVLSAGTLQVAGTVEGTSLFAYGVGTTLVIPYPLTADGGEIDLVGTASPEFINLNFSGDTLLVLNSGNVLVQGDVLQPGSLVVSGTVALFGNNVTSFVTGGTLFEGNTSATIVMTGSAGIIVNVLAEYDPTATTIIAGAGSDTISAAGGASTIFGGSGPLTFVTTPGTTLFNYTVQPVYASLYPYTAEIIGGSGAVTATGASATPRPAPSAPYGTGVAASQLFFGSASGNNVLVSGNVASTMVGGGAGDLLVENGTLAGLLVAGPGPETLTGAGSSGGNLFFGGTGSDLMIAGSAADTLVGGAGQQTIFGGNSAAGYILAGSGTDLIVAGAAQDYIAAGSGTAIVFAGAGDVFGVVQGQAGGLLEILGFQPGNDRLQLQGFAPGAATNALASAAVFGGSTILTLPDATEIVLYGVSNLTSAAFIG